MKYWNGHQWRHYEPTALDGPSSGNFESWMLDATLSLKVQHGILIEAEPSIIAVATDEEYDAVIEEIKQGRLTDDEYAEAIEAVKGSKFEDELNKLHIPYQTPTPHGTLG